MFDNGGDLVETSFLMEGLLAARQYFYGPARRGTRPLPAYHRALGRRWSGTGIAADEQVDFIYWHWSPAVGMADPPSAHRLQRSHDHLPARRSPRRRTRSGRRCITPAGPARIQRALEYRQGGRGPRGRRPLRQRHTYYGIKLDVGVGTRRPAVLHALFVLGLDPHSLHDRFTSSYFENNRNIALINRAYCIANPKHLQGLWRRRLGTDRQRRSRRLRGPRARRQQ